VSISDNNAVSTNARQQLTPFIALQTARSLVTS